MAVTARRGGRQRRLVLLAGALLSLAGCGMPNVLRIEYNPADTAERIRLDRIELPPGFEIELLSDEVPTARGMTFGADGTLFVGSQEAGKVYALDYRQRPPLTAQVIADGLEGPHGVAWRDGSLFVAAIDRIVRLDDIEANLAAPPSPRIVGELPRYRHHGLRTLRFGPDGQLYFPIGAPCNVCLPEPRYASLYRFDVDRPFRPQRIATGIRNTVGFDFDPDSGRLWFTDNGRDLLGSFAPPDELNRLDEIGQHFGFPHCHAGELPDPVYGLRSDCRAFTPPRWQLASHTAALGMRFYTGRQFPSTFRGSIFIAEHGSWNRDPLIGYRIMQVELRDGEAAAYRPFAEGWLLGDTAWGRPVDVEVAPDGALLVSDDLQGAIYRISYRGD